MASKYNARTLRKRPAPYPSWHETQSPKRPKRGSGHSSQSVSSAHWSMEVAPTIQPAYGHSIAGSGEQGYDKVNYDNSHEEDAREFLKRRRRSHASYGECTHYACTPSPKQRKHGHVKHHSTATQSCTQSTLQHSGKEHLSTQHWLEELRSSNRSLDKRTFENILSSLNPDFKESKKDVILLLQILSKSTRKRSVGYFTPLFRPQPNLTFFQCISSYICSVPQEGDLQKRISFLQILDDIITILDELLKTHPLDALEFLPIDACCGTVEQLCCQDFTFKEIQERVSQLKIQRDEIRQYSYESTLDRETIAEEDILPTPEELHSPPLSFSVPLKVNQINGPFLSVPEYISTFYSLIRADFIHPLQETLAKVKQKPELLYDHISFENWFPDYINNEIICKLKFKTRRKIKWEYSKRLTYGNLLCLSEDNFSTVIFATVAERELDDLKNGLLTVKLIGKASKNPYYSFSGKEYTMFESPTYYEAYAPIARALQMLVQEPRKLPFQNYFVKCTPHVDMPAYLKKQGVKFNLQNVICSCDNELPCKHSSIDVEEVKLERLKTSSSETIDDSQLKALCTALTRELVLIQGPPGTGKTYIGLKIVKSLLINKSIWAPSDSNVPIIIVCYTNHALDQFLEGLIIEKDRSPHLEIRRVGGRSKSDILKRYNIKTFVNRRMRIDGMPFISRDSSNFLQKRIEALKQFLDGHCNCTVDTAKMYSFFLSENIIDEIELHFDIFIDLPDFSKWGLVRKEKTVDNDTIRELLDRHRDDVDFNTIELVYDEKSLKEFVNFLYTKVQPLSDKRAEELFEDRYWRENDRLHLRLFKYCLEKLKDAWHKEMEHIAEKHAEYNRRVELTRVKCLQEADVIGLTISGAVRYHKALTQIKSKICLIEEAAEVLEPHVFLSLTSHIQQLILIGDHKQLRPKTNSNEIGYKYKLEVSLFERLVRNEFPVVTLSTQHRMRPEISRLVSKHIYEGRLKDSESVKNYKNVRGMCFNLYFVDHQESEERDEDSSSPFNMHEAHFVIHVWNYLIKNGYKPEEITIVTPYVGQLRKIRQINSTTHVSTLDNFQGEENEIILLSMVRSNEEDKVGFTRISNRVCVAMSRAKIGFYCIGNFSAYRRVSDLWKNILSDLEQSDHKLLSNKLPLQCKTHKTKTEVSSTLDFVKISRGGCGKPCKDRLPGCNHACSQECHPNDTAHDKVTCTEPCPERCSENHRCKEVCGRKCPPCVVPVDKVIPSCGHIQPIPCSVPPTNLQCQMDCKKNLSCGHRCLLRCGEDCHRKPCMFLMTKKWPCGHEAQKECHVTELDYSLKCSFPCGATLACGHLCSGKCGECRQGRLHKRCAEKCSRVLVCSHPCTEPCAMNCPPCRKDCIFECLHALCGNKCSTQCKPCPHRCEWKCEHYKCTQNCGEPCDRPRCNEPCKKKLKCGHDCIGLCGEPCPRVCRVCNKDDVTFTTIMFGEEDEPDSHFVELADCTHVIEASGLDRWIDDNTSKNVCWKKCPQCNTSIISTLRYAKQAKQVLSDINAIKKKQYNFLTIPERYNYCKEAQTLCSVALDDLSHCDVQRSLQDTLKHRLKRFKVLTVDDYSQCDSLLEDNLLILQSISQVLKTVKSLKSKSFKRINLDEETSALRFQTVDFMHWIISKLSRSSTLTDQMQMDVTSECRRITLLREVYLLQYNIGLGVTLKASDLTALKELQTKYECLGTKPCVLEEDTLQEALKNIQAISEHYLVPLTQEERQMIIKAVRAKKGSWYKCKNGHYYQIGECGGAMERSICPVCKEEIGGGQHRLAEGNEHAGEFDGSSYAVWSERANLGNYEFLN